MSRRRRRGTEKERGRGWIIFISNSSEAVSPPAPLLHTHLLFRGGRHKERRRWIVENSRFPRRLSRKKKESHRKFGVEIPAKKGATTFLRCSSNGVVCTPSCNGGLACMDQTSPSLSLSITPSPPSFLGPLPSLFLPRPLLLPPGRRAKGEFPSTRNGRKNAKQHLFRP